MAKCETECRDEIYAEIRKVEKCLDKKVNLVGVWKFVVILIAASAVFWSIITWATADGQKLKEQLIDDNRKQTAINDQRININTVQIMKLTTIIEQQSKSNESLTKEIKELIKELKK